MSVWPLPLQGLGTGCLYFSLRSPVAAFYCCPFARNSPLLSCIPAVFVVTLSSPGNGLVLPPAWSPSVPGRAEGACRSSGAVKESIAASHKGKGASPHLFSAPFLRDVSPTAPCPDSVNNGASVHLKGYRNRRGWFEGFCAKQTSCECVRWLCGCTLF